MSYWSIHLVIGLALIIILLFEGGSIELIHIMFCFAPIINVILLFGFMLETFLTSIQRKK